VWNKHFENAQQPPAATTRPGYYFCPNALNDTPLIQYTHAGPTVFVVSIDGKLHALNIVNGEDRFPPVAFVPAFSKNWSLNGAKGVVYTGISQGCAAAKSGVYALDTESADKKPIFFESAPFGAGIWGRGGVSIGTDGAVFTATGDGTPNPEQGRYSDAVVELAPKTLQVVDYYMPSNAAYLTRKDLDIGNMTPGIFSFKGRELVVIGGKEGVLELLDVKSLGGDTHRKPLYRTPQLANDTADISGMGFWGAFATYEDEGGTRWVYAPAWGPVSGKAPAFPLTNGAAPDGSIMAFKVEEQNGQAALIPAWISGNLSVPEPPIIANGVVFALSSGEFTRQLDDNGHGYTAQERMSHNPGHAVLYAFDAKTGKELFNSGNTIPSFTHLGGIAASDGRVFVTTYDSTVYAFGIPGQ
jgi:outer membrane protein assembly factor BamB